MIRHKRPPEGVLQQRVDKKSPTITDSTAKQAEPEHNIKHRNVNYSHTCDLIVNNFFSSMVHIFT
jgi:hypothetical protein